MLGLGSSLVYDGGTLADELLDTYPGAAAAYSLRSLNSDYSGAAVSVRPEEGVIGMVLQGGETGYSGGFRRKPGAYPVYPSTETGRLSLEVYYDAQGLPDGETHRWQIRYGYTASDNQGFTSNPNIPNRQWKKIQFSAVSVDSGNIELYPTDSSYIPIPGDQIFVRNIRCEAPSFSVDYDVANWAPMNGGGSAYIADAFDVGFDSNGGLDQEAVTTFARSAADALVLNVTDDYGDADSLVGIDKTYNEVTNAGTGTLTFDVYADCPSIAGSVAIHAGVGTIQTAVAGSPVTQGEWTSVTRSSATTADHGRIAIYVGGDGTSTLNQQLAAGDKIYIRNLRFVHDNGAGDDLDSLPDFTSGLGGFAEYNDTSAVSLSYATSPTIDLYLQSWYDQSGNSNDATQTTAASQPKIYDWDNGLVTENGKPAVEFDGTNDYLSLDAATNLTNTTCQVIVTVYDTSTSEVKMPMGSSTTFWQHYNSNQVRVRTSSGDLPYTTGLSNGSQYVGVLNGTGTNYVIRQNGVEKISQSSTSNVAISEIGRGFDNNAYAFDNNIQEVIIYESDKSSILSGIEANVNDYYSIYS
ncbi:MAG: hypothetical protein VXB01_04465 [Opitutae bacterium]